MSIVRHFVLTAGGTGGHIMPAYALAHELVVRGHKVALVTDARGARIPGLPDGVEVHTLPAGRLGGGPIGWIKAARAIWAGRRQAKRLYTEFKPTAVIGFGGYPALPALLAAQSMGIKTAIHEQNAVLGRVNRYVAKKVAVIATAYPNVARIPDGCASKVELVGNPVRDEIIALRELPYPHIDENTVFRVLVIGGSQGASILSEVVPDGLAMLPIALRQRLQVTQQCRIEDIDAVRARFADLGIPADLATYMEDIPERLSWTHLMIARAGASTLAELTVAGRPAILIPLPIATDDHQTANTREMVAAGGARMIVQAQFTSKELAKQMQKLGLEPKGLTLAAEAAKSCGRPNATRDLANLLEKLGRPPVVDALKAKPMPAGAVGAAA